MDHAEPSSASFRPAGRDGHILVLDAGSSSLHMVLFAPDGTVAARKDTDTAPGERTRADLENLLDQVPFSPQAVGHRLVHGGSRLRHHVLVDDEVRGQLEEAAAMAPLHVPAALTVLDAARDLLPRVPHAACLDTAFHADLPKAAREYAVPETWRTRYGIRRYGFHGLSYTWAVHQAATHLGRSVRDLQLIAVHLGGGCSACAVHGGRSLDTTMGFTPLEGLVMSHRSGSVDPGALTWLQQRCALSAADLDDALNHHSGLLGLSGTSGDTRDLVRARAAGDERAALALAVFAHHARRGIASMAASLHRIDALVFTGEIGEDQPEIRQEICAGLAVLGLNGDLTAPGPEGAQDTVTLSSADAAVPVLMVPTGETQQVALETRTLLDHDKPEEHE